MSTKASIETLRRVYDDGEGACVEVGPDQDGLGMIEIRTVGEANQAYFGKTRLTLSVEVASKLVEALAAAVKETEAAEKETV